MSILLLGYWLQAVISLSGKSTTFDELLHVTAGYAYWSQNDYRLQPENGNLPQRWMALPVLVLGYSFPQLKDDPAWHRSEVSVLGREFFYQSGNDADRLLFWSRGMIGLVGVGLGALIYVIARELFDASVALASVVLFAFCPTMLAYGALATSDMTVTFFFLASVWCAWQLLHQVNFKNLLQSSLAVGGLFLAKFSAPLVIPMIGILVVLRVASHEPLPVALGRKTWVLHTRTERAAVFGVIAALHAVACWFFVWISFGLRFAAMAQSQPGRDRLLFDWGSLLRDSGFFSGCLKAIRDLHLLPEAYLYGSAFMSLHVQRRSAFLNGEYSVTGWAYFFPYCVMVKTPLPLFALMGLGLLAIVAAWLSAPTSTDGARRIAATLYGGAPLWSLFSVYWLAALTSHLNVGLRHLLPTYPVMLILAGAAATWLSRQSIDATGGQPALPNEGGWKKTSSFSRFTALRWPKLASLTLILFGLLIAESITQAPNFLAYFNQLVGGPRYGYRHLVDSSLDWGQDLPALKHWLATQTLSRPTRQTQSGPIKKYVSYFGSGLPNYYGVDVEAEFLPCYFPVPRPRVPTPLAGGLYCVSATMLQQVYSLLPGPWTRNYENAYQQLAKGWRLYESTANDPKARQNLVSQYSEAEWTQFFQSYEQARFGRLCSYLRQREPDAEINYSILVYRLTSDDLRRALDGPPVELERNSVARY